jgi:hypothetical protein
MLSNRPKPAIPQLIALLQALKLAGHNTTKFPNHVRVQRVEVFLDAATVIPVMNWHMGQDPASAPEATVNAVKERTLTQRVTAAIEDLGQRRGIDVAIRDASEGDCELTENARQRARQRVRRECHNRHRLDQWLQRSGMLRCPGAGATPTRSGVDAIGINGGRRRARHCPGPGTDGVDDMGNQHAASRHRASFQSPSSSR